MVIEKYARSYAEVFDKLDRAEWNYEDGCVLIGLQVLYDVTGDEYYFNTIKNYIDRYVAEDGTIKGYNQLEYNLDRIPSGRVLYMLYERTGSPKYRAAIEKLMEQLRNHPRTKCGSFWHKKIYPNQIWLDGLYMGMPYYALYDKHFGDGSGLVDIVNQFKNARKYLYDDKTGLYYHGYDESREVFWADKETGLSQNIWSRALGWYMMGLVDCYEIIGDAYPEGAACLKEIYCEMVETILKYQDKESGLFYQLTVLPEVEGNDLETSSSLMFAYAIIKGCRLNLIDGTYKGKGEEILIGLETRMFSCSHGKLSLGGMCLGAGLGPEDNHRRDGTIEYYLAEPVVHDEQKSAGVAMMACGEWMRMDKSVGKEGSYPSVGIYNDGYPLLR